MESEDPLTVVEKDDNGFVFYKCRFCGLTFNYMNTLRAHERVHNISQVGSAKSTFSSLANVLFPSCFRICFVDGCLQSASASLLLP